MQIAQKLAGYTLGGADLLRRAMGKKKPEEMAKQKSIFVEGALEERRHAGGRRAHLRPARVLRGLRLQQEPLGGVRAHHVPDGVAQGALPGGAALRDPHERQGPHRQGGAHDRRRAGDGDDGAPAGRERERHRLQGRLHAPRRRRPGAARRDRIKDALGPQIRFGLGAVRGLGGAALEAVFEARARRAVPRSVRSGGARRRQARQQGGLRGARAVRGVRHDAAGARRHACAGVRLGRRGARAVARGEPRSRGGADEPLRAVRRGRRRRGRVGAERGRLRRVRAVGPAASSSCASGSRSASTSRATRSSAT